MDVASSAGTSTSPVVAEDEPIPANEPSKTALVSAITDRRLDGDGRLQIVDARDQNKERMSSEEILRTSAPVASVSASLPTIKHEYLSTASTMTDVSTLCFGPNEDRQTCLIRKDADLDLDIERHGAQSNLSKADDNLDLEKGLSGIRPQSQITSHDTGHTKAIAQEKLDRNGSSGERVCRVCYLGLSAQPESGPGIELGCQCKDDLAFAHRQCAEAWFKIKGNRTCEICGSTVQNVSGINDSTFMENWNNGDSRPAVTSDGERCWQNHRLFNILLACMVFAFVLPWLFHVSSLFR